MGHVDLQSMKPYQHHRLDPLREAIDRRNEENGSRHVLRHGGQNGAEHRAECRYIVDLESKVVDA
jgi:hypothetical protein